MRSSIIYKWFIIITFIINIIVLITNISNLTINIVSILFIVLWPLIILYSLKKKDKNEFKLLFILAIIYSIITLIATFGAISNGFPIDYFNLFIIITNTVLLGFVTKEFSE